MKISILILFFFSSISAWCQSDSTYYDSGELLKYSYKDDKGHDTLDIFFYKSGKLKAEQFYDSLGTLTYNYMLGENGDTVFTSIIPLLRAQPNKDLSNINWKSSSEGIFYSIENLSKGKKLVEGQTISVWYIGYFIDGSQFDNSDISGDNLSIILGDSKYLKSLQDGLKHFNIGASGYIKIPPELGYGSKAYSNIPPNSTLIYYVKILE